MKLSRTDVRVPAPRVEPQVPDSLRRRLVERAGRRTAELRRRLAAR